MGDVVKEIQRRRAQKTIIEHSPVRESQANGVAERAVQHIEGIVRTLKLALKKNISREIPCTHPIITWLVEHSADLINKFGIGRGGRTAYERLKGKAYRGEMMEFGSGVYYRVPGTPEGGLMAERWLEGVWLGKKFNSDEHVVGMRGGSLCKTRSVRRKLESESWVAEDIEGIKGIPRNLRGTC